VRILLWLLALVVIGLPLLAWLTDLCLIDAAIQRRRIQDAIHESEQRAREDRP
jgi:hypothetical protein